MLENWLEAIVQGYAERLLEFDADCAQVWGKLMASQNQHPVDKQIASIAIIYGINIVTRNISDFAGTGATLINPFV